MVEYGPLGGRVLMYPADDLFVEYLRSQLPEELSVATAIVEEHVMPCVIVQTTAVGRTASAGRSLVYTVELDLWVFTSGLDAKQDGALWCEQLREVIEGASRSGWKSPEGVWISRASLVEMPHRETDWAPAVGPVQYADLPQDFERSAMQVRVTFRRS